MPVRLAGAFLAAAAAVGAETPRDGGRRRGARWSARGACAALKGYRLPAGAPRRPGRAPSRAAAALLAAVAVAGLAAAPARAGDGERRVVCLGDSLTEGYGLAPEQSYPRVLERELRGRGLAVRVVNAGISGSTSASAVSRMRWQLRARPDVVVLALGANDGLRGLDLGATRDHLARAIELAKSQGVRVVLAGMKIPPNYGPEYTRNFAALFPALAEEHGVTLLPFLLEGVAADPDLNQPDGVHPNARGAEIVARNVLAVLLPILSAEKAATGDEEAAAP